MSKALIVVDVQNDFCEGGALAVAGGNSVAKDVDCLQDYSLKLSTKDWHIDPGEHFETWPVHCVANTEGAELHPNIYSVHRSGDRIFRKGQYSDGYSGFEGVNKDGLSLSEYLLKYRTFSVDIVGLAFDHCVRATALDARRLGLETTVLLNYTAAVSAEGAWGVARELTEAGVVLR